MIVEKPHILLLRQEFFEAVLGEAAVCVHAETGCGGVRLTFLGCEVHVAGNEHSIAPKKVTAIRSLKQLHELALRGPLPVCPEDGGGPVGEEEADKGLRHRVRANLLLQGGAAPDG
jgi:hypothetical protein